MNLETPLKSSQELTIALAGALLMAAAIGIGRFAYTPLLPSMQETLGWTASQTGDMASSHFLGYMIGALVASLLVHQAERKLWLLAGMIFSALTTLAGAVVVCFSAWLGIRFFSGVASAFCLVLGTAIVVEYLASYSRPQLGALHFSGVGIGIVISVFVIEFVRFAGSSVFTQWGGLGIVSVILFAGSWLIIRTLPKHPRLVESIKPQTPKQSPSMPPLLKRLIVAYGLFGFGYVITATFIVAMARRLESVALFEPLTWVIVGLLAAPSIFFWQYLAERVGMYPALRLAYSFEAAGVLFAGFASGPIAVVIGGALLGGTLMGITALGLIAARQAAGSNQGQVIGWMTASFGLGQLLGPAIAGRLAQITQGFGAPSMVAALLLIIGLALLWGLERE